MLVCSEGHILQNYRNETTELTETVGHVLRQRRTGNTKLKTKRQRANPAVYHGNRARLLYFQSLQLLLRLQVNALQKLWELPPEFEAISRDVWTLYLTMMREQLHLEITTDFDPAMRPEEDQSLIEGYKEPTINPESKELSDSDQVVGSSDDEKAEISLEPNNDLTDLLNKLSDVSSDSSGEEELQVTEGRDYQRVKLPGTRGNRSTSRQSSPLCTIAVLVISCWMLRIPVLYIDLINLVNDFTLPYLNVVARGIIPGSMIVHMSPALVHSLSIQISPRPLQLHSLSSRITRKLHNTYQIEVPEANTSHILARAIEALHLPTVFYHMTKTFADMLRIPLTLHPSLSTQVVDTSGKLLTMQRGDNIPVELALICAIILLLKLIYGLDGRLRKDISEDDFLPGLPPQEEILSRLRREDEQVSGAEARTALELTPSDIDHYLDFCTKALLGNNMQCMATHSEYDRTLNLLQHKMCCWKERSKYLRRRPPPTSNLGLLQRLVIQKRQNPYRNRILKIPSHFREGATTPSSAQRIYWVTFLQITN